MKPRKETKLKLQPSAVLLDKGLVRRIYEFQARLVRLSPPASQQVEAMKLYLKLRQRGGQIYISIKSANLLRLRPPQIVGTLLQATETLRPGRYQRRWARRMRAFAFTREDAMMLAYGSFGVDALGRHPVIEVFITNDFALAANFQTNAAKLNDRFERMVFNLSDPYCRLTLPAVLTAPQALSLL